MTTQMSIEALRSCFEDAAAREVKNWDGWPQNLSEASAYVFLGGGKRVRPILALSCAQLFGDYNRAQAWALAVELIHTYSLVHDDLPAMDDDNERRGKPTCHVAYDESTAILVGDALLTRAFGLIAEYPTKPRTAVRLLSLLADASGGSGMVGGQVDDLGGNLSTLDNLVDMQNKKTGALLAAAAVGGGICLDADENALNSLETFGRKLGLLFQLTDDIIDKGQDADRESNNFHHHLTDVAVCEWRDRLVADCETALVNLPGDTRILAQIVQQISRRKV